MKHVNWKQVTDQKNVIRAKNAARPYAEKLDRLDALRERSAAMRSAARDATNTGRTAPARKK